MSDTFHLGIIELGLTQLTAYRKQPRTIEDKNYLEADIEAYEEILASNKDENAKAFLELKHESIRSGKPFPNNTCIVSALKKQGLWK
jgi:hypothetical protein